MHWKEINGVEYEEKKNKTRSTLVKEERQSVRRTRFTCLACPGKHPFACQGTQPTPTPGAAVF